MDAKLFGKNLLLLRKEKGLTQQALANIAKISRNYISMIERGQVENVSDEIINELALGLDVSREQLTGEPSSEVGVHIPPSLREFGLRAGLSYKVVDKLSQIPFRGKEPQIAEEWEKLYHVVKDYITEE